MDKITISHTVWNWPTDMWVTCTSWSPATCLGTAYMLSWTWDTPSPSWPYLWHPQLMITECCLPQLTTLHLPLHQTETRHDEQLQHAPPHLDQLLTVLSLLQTEQYLEVSSGWTGVVEESVDLGAGEERQESGECWHQGHPSTGTVQQSWEQVWRQEQAQHLLVTTPPDNVINVVEQQSLAQLSLQAQGEWDFRHQFPGSNLNTL